MITTIMIKIYGDAYDDDCGHDDDWYGDDNDDTDDDEDGDGDEGWSQNV